MSQEKVQQILEDLGGRATISQIRKEAKRRYPGTTLYTYVSKRLAALEKWGVVAESGGLWKLIGEPTRPLKVKRKSKS
ncbi:MAG: hypothetical protein WCB19_07660 [Thermoplasmata archaeon]